jgi:hypothetical protein
MVLGSGRSAAGPPWTKLIEAYVGRLTVDALRLEAADLGIIVKGKKKALLAFEVREAIIGRSTLSPPTITALDLVCGNRLEPRSEAGQLEEAAVALSTNMSMTCPQLRQILVKRLKLTGSEIRVLVNTFPRCIHVRRVEKCSSCKRMGHRCSSRACENYPTYAAALKLQKEAKSAAAKEEDEEDEDEEAWSFACDLEARLPPVSHHRAAPTPRKSLLLLCYSLT